MQYQIIYTLFNELKYEVSNLLLNFAWNVFDQKEREGYISSKILLLNIFRAVCQSCKE